MDSYNIQETVRRLSDAELAVLVCLVAGQHCIIRATSDSVLDLQQELQAMSIESFGLSCATIDCTEKTTLEAFSEAVLQPADTTTSQEDEESLSPIMGVSFGTHAQSNTLDNRRVANVIVATHLNQAPHLVQIQALELMRSRRIYTREAAHGVPKHFILVALLSEDIEGPPFLTHYLNDFFFISHIHRPADVLDSNNSSLASETSSISSAASIIRKPSRSSYTRGATAKVNISDSLLTHLQDQLRQVRLTAEVRRYIHNIVTFMRLHRAVQGGVSAISSRHLTILSRVLAPLHGIDYVTPSLVALAVRKVYPHRIEITPPEDERSMQWGSSLDMVTQMLEGVTPETVIDDVLQAVESPL